MGARNVSAIVARNQDVEHIVNAAAHVGMYGVKEMMPKRLGLLVAADIHLCSKQLDSAIDYLNEMEALDAGICLGDMQGSHFTESDACWYPYSVAHTKKPFYTVIGNHDCGNSAEDRYAGTKEEIFQK